MATPSPVRLRCISPMGDRDLTHIPEVGRIVAVGEVIEVPAVVAGAKAGTYRAPTDAELASPTGFAGLRTRGGDTGPDGQERPLDVRDPGSGLLAQLEHWQRVDASTPLGLPASAEDTDTAAEGRTKN